MRKDLIIYKHGILNEMENAFRGLAGKRAPTFVAVDENGAYQYTKNTKDSQENTWDEQDIACFRPLPDDFHLSGPTLAALSKEPDELFLSELRNKDPETIEEILKISATEAKDDFEDILCACAARAGCTVRDVAETALDSSESGNEGNIALILAFLIQGTYLKGGIPLESVSFDTPLAEICRIIPGKEEYLQWTSALQNSQHTQKGR
jgi:hypothetical protein